MEANAALVWWASFLAVGSLVLLVFLLAAGGTGRVDSRIEEQNLREFRSSVACPFL